MSLALPSDRDPGERSRRNQERHAGLGYGPDPAAVIVVVTDHTDFDYSQVLEVSKLVVDTRNAMKTLKSEKIVRL